MNYHGKRDSGAPPTRRWRASITFLTEDMDRLLAFYVRVFDAEGNWT